MNKSGSIEVGKVEDRSRMGSRQGRNMIRDRLRANDV
jgi:hypothetical protein